MNSTTLIVNGIIAHLVVDWLLQGSWQAANKCNPLHPAAWVHGGAHVVALALAGFPLPVAALLGLAHLALDTRRPLRCWGRVMRLAGDGPIALHVCIWRDQTCHFALIALAAWLVR